MVVGAGQAGLSAAFHLRRRGFVPATDAADAADAADPLSTPPLSYIVLDAERGPGGAWQHRWNSLRMATVNGIHDLPGIAKPQIDPNEPSSQMLPRYFASYEQQLELPVLRPVVVTAVRREDDDPHGRLLIETDAGTWSARAVINATGTWTKPFWPSYPGRSDFAGRQLHVADYVSAEEFAGEHVVVVGGGISAVQLLEEISHVTATSWFTRREPEWRDEEFDSQAGHDAVARVEERVRLGLPPQSVVAVTGLIWSPVLRAAAARGVFDRRPMFSRIERDGVRLADGGFLHADVILWATGFRAALDHLAPLKLRGPGGGIVMDKTMVAGEPRVHLIGYGPSASTIGANRAGRDAANSLVALLGSDDPQRVTGQQPEAGR
ncbi:NAD(P)-binding domain-containing protein [Compostimonas suwonensis]|uniref:NAD(P)-binding domain-containing protein n=1 Tax=Compostimonas suwonensis TaxID=1048394 RepID=UPI000C2483A2|nr:NAD(P)-binding domain-containing protein [Compostimonas suwonensis]